MLSSITTTSTVLALLLAARPADAQTVNDGVNNVLKDLGLGGACANYLSGTQAGIKACEWTGACGKVGTADCSNKCIASASVLAAEPSPGTLRTNATLETTSVLGCNYVATLITTINGYVGNGRRRLSQLDGLSLNSFPAIPADMCPDDAAIDKAVKSPVFKIGKDVVLPAIGAKSDLINAASTADGLKNYIKDYCTTAKVGPPLSSLFKVPGNTNNADTGGTFCRDNGCRLERRFGHLPPEAIQNGTQGIADAFSKLINDKCVKPGAVPNGQCTPNAVYLDSGCLVEVLPKLSPKPLTNLTATEAAPVVTTFVALQEKCASLTDQTSCTSASFPAEEKAATDAFNSVITAAIGADPLTGSCNATTGTAIGPAAAPEAVTPPVVSPGAAPGARDAGAGGVVAPTTGDTSDGTASPTAPPGSSANTGGAAPSGNTTGVEAASSATPAVFGMAVLLAVAFVSLLC